MLNAVEETRQRPLLGSVAPAEFIGRGDDLARLVAHAETTESGAPLLLLAAPAAGASELLRQAYDELFAKQGAVVPIYFAWTTADRHAGQAARRFLQTFLSQLAAFRRQDANLCHSLLSAREIIELAPLGDQEWMERLWEAVETARREGDEAELVRLCLSGPQRARQQGTRVCVFFDHLHAADWLSNGVALVSEILTLFAKSGAPAVLAGYRRGLLGLAQKALDTLAGIQVMRLEQLAESDAGQLLEALTAQAGVALNDECRDLLVEQTERSPVFLCAIVEAARAGSVSLDSFRRCQEVYVRELLGGRISRIFAKAWDEIVAPPALIRQLLPLLCGDEAGQVNKVALSIWRKRLQIDELAFSRLLRQLHAREWVEVSGVNVEMRRVSRVWRDYVKLRCRLETEGKPRAQVLADALAETLKRAPRLMSRRYRRSTVLPLRPMLVRFDGQSVPYSLLDAHHFALHYEDLEPSELAEALRREETRLPLPQVVNVATCVSYQPAMKLVGEAEGCLVAHGFTAGRYTDDDEIIWVAAQLEAKNAAGLALVKVWHEGLRDFAAGLGLSPARLWLLSLSGFTAEARAYLTEHGIYGSNAAQFEHLQQLLAPESATPKADTADDFELVIPMAEESELVATSALEQIARRVALPSAMVNQIKTALVEACINAAEHSHSPDRKIYQRFTVSADKLTITVASRGVTQPQLSGVNLQDAPVADNGNADRRGWGLKLIRSLMDEVEFERVDDGTRLRMTKFLK